MFNMHSYSFDGDEDKDRASCHNSDLVGEEEGTCMVNTQLLV